MDVISGDKYQHFKNKQIYEIIGVALHSETLEEMIVYKALYHSEQFGNESLWIRPKKMFFEQVTVDGVTMPRFQKY